MVQVISKECDVEVPYPSIEYMEGEVKKDFGGDMPDFTKLDMDNFANYYENKMISIRGGSGLKLMKGRIRSVYVVYRFYFFDINILKHRYWMPTNMESVPKYIKCPVIIN